jgi:hypothetical protein
LKKKKSWDQIIPSSLEEEKKWIDRKETITAHWMKMKKNFTLKEQYKSH